MKRPFPTRRLRLPVVALCAAVLLGASSASAQVQDIYFANTVSYEIHARVAASGVGSTPINAADFQQTFNTQSKPVALNFGVEHSAGGDSGTSHVKVDVAATANHGRLGVQYSGEVDAATNAALKNASGVVDFTTVQARWQDTLFFYGNQPGRKTTLTATLPITGVITGSAGSVGGEIAYTDSALMIYAYGNGADILAVAPYGFNNVFALNTLNAIPGTEPAPRNFEAPVSATVIMTLTENQPYVLDYRLEINGAAWAVISLSPNANSLTAEADWSVNFLHTLMWGGITSVTDTLTGVPINNYTLTSASGIDYTVAMPEPGSLGLLTLGGAALMLRRKRAGR